MCWNNKEEKIILISCSFVLILMYVRLSNLYHLHWYIFPIYSLYKLCVILLLNLGSQCNVAIPPLIFVRSVQINITSGGMAAELVVTFDFVLMLYLPSYYNVIGINPFRSYVEPRPTVWFSCSAPMSEDVRHGFCCVSSPAVGACPTLFLM
jgi:hypothetical protein